MAPTVVRRPYLGIQCDWNDVLKENDSKVWVTCKEFGHSGKHGELFNHGRLQHGVLQFAASEGFRIENIGRNTLTISHEDPNCRCHFVAPNNSFSSIHQKSVICLDVTSGGLGVSCSEKKLCIWDTQTGEIRRYLDGHVWDVYTCRFFPSGIVVLSGGGDMMLKIWSAESGQCPVTLKGHTAAVVDTAIVDRGRNVVSVSKDGTARLWDCGYSSCLDVLMQECGSINSCTIAPVFLDTGQPNNPKGEREVGTDGKLLILGCENGSLLGVGLHSRKSVFNFNCSSAVNCCAFLSQFTVVCGTQAGLIYLLDIRDTREPVITWEEAASPVLTLLSYRDGFFAGKSDGTCIFCNTFNEEMVQLTGSDFDPIYKIAHDGSNFYTACRDGQIRKYKLTVKL